MKTLVFHTDKGLPLRPLRMKRIFWVERANSYDPYGRLEVKSTVVLSTPPRPLAEMLTEVEDGAHETDVRAAIQAAALADDWRLAESFATRYGLVICLRCATDMQYRPGLRLSRLLGLRDCWGEVCGSCAVEMLELQQG